jgi:hypothetical protein
LIISGGQIGADAYIGSNLVEISGGSIGSSTRLAGNLTIKGGAFAPGVYIEASSAAISGGQFGDDLTIEGYNTVITGGRFEDVLSNAYIRVAGGEFVDDLVIANGKHVHIDSGTIHELQLNPSSQAFIKGGQQTQINAFDDSVVTIYGWGFSVDGVPLSGLSMGQLKLITNRDVILRGTLSDGKLFAYELNTQFQLGEDFFDEESLVNVVLSTPLGDYNGNGVVDTADYVVWRKTDGSQAGYNLWRANLGRTTGGSGVGTNAGVPEPQAIALLLTGLLAACLRHHGRHC